MAGVLSLAVLMLISSACAVELRKPASHLHPKIEDSGELRAKQSVESISGKSLKAETETESLDDSSNDAFSNVDAKSAESTEMESKMEAEFEKAAAEHKWNWDSKCQRLCAACDNWWQWACRQAQSSGCGCDHRGMQPSTGRPMTAPHHARSGGCGAVQAVPKPKPKKHQCGLLQSTAYTCYLCDNGDERSCKKACQEGCGCEKKNWDIKLTEFKADKQATKEQVQERCSALCTSCDGWWAWACDQAVSEDCDCEKMKGDSLLAAKPAPAEQCLVSHVAFTQRKCEKGNTAACASTEGCCTSEWEFLPDDGEGSPTLKRCNYLCESCGTWWSWACDQAEREGCGCEQPKHGVAVDKQHTLRNGELADEHANSAVAAPSTPCQVVQAAPPPPKIPSPCSLLTAKHAFSCRLCNKGNAAACGQLVESDCSCDREFTSEKPSASKQTNLRKAHTKQEQTTPA